MAPSGGVGLGCTYHHLGGCPTVQNAGTFRLPEREDPSHAEDTAADEHRGHHVEACSAQGQASSHAAHPAGLRKRVPDSEVRYLAIFTAECFKKHVFENIWEIQSAHLLQGEA
eukprot:3475657-Amphidinium_carterae.1